MTCLGPNPENFQQRAGGGDDRSSESFIFVAARSAGILGLLFATDNQRPFFTIWKRTRYDEPALAYPRDDEV